MDWLRVRENFADEVLSDGFRLNAGFQKIFELVANTGGVVSGVTIENI